MRLYLRRLPLRVDTYGMKRPQGPIVRLPERPYRLRGGAETLDPRLDRLIQFDEESRNYPIRELLGPREQSELRSKTWGSTARLDQGEEGACVGFAWSHDLEAEPDVVPNVDTALAHRIYKRAQTIDEWPGEEYSGTSVLAGAKAVQELGHLSEYRWAFGVEDVLATIAWHGPVVLGVKWYYQMYYPDGQGYIALQGQVVGGHAILAVGYDHENREVWLQNSWGADWGQNGLCRLTVEHLDALLQDDGEACVPVVRTPSKDAGETGAEGEVAPEVAPQASATKASKKKRTPSEKSGDRGRVDERKSGQFSDWLDSMGPDSEPHRESHRAADRVRDRA